MFGLFKKKPKEENVVNDPAPDNEPEGPVAEVANELAADEQDAMAKVEADLKRTDAEASSDFVPPEGVGSGIPSGIPGFDYSPVDPNEEFKATAGKPLESGATVATEDAVVEALCEVYDPEIPVNIYDLGLIYGLDIQDGGDIKIEMSLTAPGCPVAGEMPGMVARAVEAVEGTGEIEVLLVWEPQWTPERMSEDAKLALGMG